MKKSLILVCGQGSVGKSTYAKTIYDYCQKNDINSAIVAVDAFDDVKNLTSDEQLIMYKDQLVQAMYNYTCVIGDYSQELERYRLDICKYISNYHDLIDWQVVVICLHPSFDTILNRYIQRGIDEEVLKNWAPKLHDIYNNFQIPTEEEGRSIGCKQFYSFVLNNDLDIKEYNLNEIYSKLI